VRGHERFNRGVDGASGTCQLLEDLMLEIIGAANACGVPIGTGFAQAMLDSTRQMKPYSPSMKLDFDHRRPWRSMPSIPGRFGQPMLSDMTCPKSGCWNNNSNIFRILI